MSNPFYFPCKDTLSLVACFHLVVGGILRRRARSRAAFASWRVAPGGVTRSPQQDGNAELHLSPRWLAPVLLSADAYLGQDLGLGASTLYFNLFFFFLSLSLSDRTLM